MQVLSSMTITPADPSMLPALAMESKSSRTSTWSAVSTGVEDPPGTMALSLRPGRTPPQ